MESKYHYFKRDVSWLSFNHRVLLEADDDSLPLYERINFISIYSSNLEEFYKVRIAEHKAVANGGYSEDMTQEEARQLIHQIGEEVNKQLEDRIRIYEQKIIPGLKANHIIFYQSQQEVEDMHRPFIANFFMEEIFPYLLPVPVCKERVRTFIRDNRLYLSTRVIRKDTGEKEYFIMKLPYSKVPRFIELPKVGDNHYLMFMEEIFPYLLPVPVCKERVRTFIRDNRLYLSTRVIRKDTGEKEYFIMKLPYSKVPRFIELPKVGDNYYLMFMEDIIKANIGVMFPGYEVDCSYCCKISRDADVFVDDASTSEKMVEQLKKKVKKRKIGAVCRFVYDRHMPQDYLDYLADAFDINRDELIPGDKHLNLEDLSNLPNPNKELLAARKPQPMYLDCLGKKQSVFRYVGKRDLLLHYPYYSFDHFIHFLYEAVHDPSVKEIMITQYRVAPHSEVINTLIAAAQNGKRVTVFVELKARFDEENNLATAELMQKAGIHIIYSIPGLKVHAKVALVLRYHKDGRPKKSFAYISTGNFNEKTATFYADSALVTSNQEMVDDLHNLFRLLSKEITEPKFKHLLVPRFNLLPELKRRLGFEMNMACAGKKAHIILKMNALQDPTMIEELYRASEAGVQIDLIVRGICCLIPNQPYSRNIRITRIVDGFLEHARVWYFYNGGQPLVYMGSPDWMRRNLYRRIEAVTPILDARLKQEMIDMLHIQLADNQKAGWVDEHLRNVMKRDELAPPVRAQYAFYEYLKEKNE